MLLSAVVMRSFACGYEDAAGRNPLEQCIMDKGKKHVPKIRTVPLSSQVSIELKSSSLDSSKVMSEVLSKIEALETQLQAAVDEEDYDTAHIL